MLRFFATLKSYIPNEWWPMFRPVFWCAFWSIEWLRESYKYGAMAPKLYGSERAVFLQAVLDAEPIENLLEVGCGFGTNLHTLAYLLPNTSLVGIDRDISCISGGMDLLKDKEVPNAKLAYLDVVNMGVIADGSYELVVSCASLLSIDRLTISTAMQEMVRVCRNTLIIVEPHLENPYFAGQSQGVYVLRDSGLGGYWVRDYRQLILSYAPHARITINRIPASLWNNEHWKFCGSCIVAQLGDSQQCKQGDAL